MHPTVERIFRIRHDDLLKNGLLLPRVVLILSGLFFVTALGMHLWFIMFMKPLSQEVYTPTAELIEFVKTSERSRLFLTHIQVSETAIRTFVDGFHVIAVCTFTGLAILLLILSLVLWKLFEVASVVDHKNRQTSLTESSPARLPEVD